MMKKEEKANPPVLSDHPSSTTVHLFFMSGMISFTSVMLIGQLLFNDEACLKKIEGKTLNKLF
jgi:hypothetical protein